MKNLALSRTLALRVLPVAAAAAVMAVTGVAPASASPAPAAARAAHVVSGSTPSKGTITHRPVSPSDLRPANSMVCNGHTCQQLEGTGLTLTKWQAGAVQAAGTTVCNPAVSFRYNVTTTPAVYETVQWPGCFTAPAGQSELWTWDAALDHGPLTFSDPTWVQIGWNSGFGNSPNAHVF